MKTRADVQQMFFASRQFNLNMQRIYSALYILTNSLHSWWLDQKEQKCLPTENELEEFNAIAFPVIEQINSNKVENKRLSALRDALLPKLLSGEIDISTIDF